MMPHGNTTDDYIIAKAGKDIVIAFDGNDVVKGGNGADLMAGVLRAYPASSPAP